MTETIFAPIPMQVVGPVLVKSPEFEAELPLPLATYETPLWPSVNRGARVATAAGGLSAVVIDERMSRSILVECADAVTSFRLTEALEDCREELAEVASRGSRFARLRDFHTQQVGRLLYIRLELFTGDASGHNMVTAAAEHVMNWLLEKFPEAKYVSLSGNFCCDKKVSAVNGILGRGRSVICEATIPERLVNRYLKSTPEKIAELNYKKNWIGTGVGGAVRAANAHFANMLLAFYLATGQDAANIVEGSQGFVHAEAVDGGLYFSVTLPHMIVGTVGNGKGLDFVHKNMELLGCCADVEPGVNTRRLAIAGAASVWCGELSLLAALTNPGELMEAHRRLERQQ